MSFSLPTLNQPARLMLTSLTLAGSMGIGSVAQANDWRDNERLSLDFASRWIYNDEINKTSSILFGGIDYRTVFSDENGDWGTLNAQVYLTSLNNLAPHPAQTFDDDDDTKIVYRILNFNYTGLAKGKVNFRIGHFEVPYGIEQVIATNGTVHQYMQPQNIGVKADWGVSVNGILPDYEYEVALTRGSGNEWENNGDSYIFAGRIGTARERNVVLGLSALTGETVNGQGPATTKRKRYGVDAQWHIHSFTLLGEVSTGENNDQDILNGLAELGWNTPTDSVFLYSQIKHFSGDSEATGWSKNSTGAIGARFEPNNNFSADVQYAESLSSDGKDIDPRTFVLQLRYRY